MALTDPIADRDKVRSDYGRAPIVLGGERYDLVVAAVAHDEYRALSDQELAALVALSGTLADLKGMWRDRDPPASIDRWAL